ncbi:hypothetical protein LCGC14_2823970, partial [marine sediment metagenome]
MIWSGKGQHEGEDVNDIPDSYFDYMSKNSKNPNSVQVADQVIAYRRNSGYTVPDPPRGQQGSKPATNDVPVSTGSIASNSPQLRARALELAIMIDSKNPWPYIKPVTDYIRTQQLPNLASMLTDEKPQENAPQKNPYLSELCDDEIP